jgi:hypothetical protein
MKNFKLLIPALLVLVCLFSCGKGSSPSPSTTTGETLSITLTYTNFDPTKDVLTGSLAGSTATEVYSDWSVNGVERKGEQAFTFDNSYVVNNTTTFNTNSEINSASLTIGGVAPQGAPFTITVQATKNGKALDPVTVQIVGATTVRSFGY